jgi:hypothetical protein
VVAWVGFEQLGLRVQATQHHQGTVKTLAFLIEAVKHKTPPQPVFPG